MYPKEREPQFGEQQRSDPVGKDKAPEAQASEKGG